jgi:hypothetical protein
MPRAIAPPPPPPSPSPPPPSPSPPPPPFFQSVAGRRRLEAAVKPAVKPAVERAVEDSGTLLGEAKRSAASEAPRKGFLRTFDNLWGWTRTGRSASHDS